ncbi:DUF2812 domain-containing protein [Anaerocolumna sedimenticola]|uniref:DUF2812 domain-containing protein n=1 Tax=Anaerocolumna sedimenticola TaxID=2696063 RepID=A0A6P1THI4_9FIRM|nr:DUF2812 domain-containing protein [Anaerocolumna sedimenticola]QHQ59757.1 DUF2812 domain-containing protein [Anaerocolumna sedimenticola]
MKIFRWYYDKDKEEKWLNQMCEKGYALKRFFLGLYTFEPCEKGEYVYRIDLLHNWEGDKYDYVSFMEEYGVEYVAQWYRWVFLRKKAADGAFDLYTDSASQVQHYIRIRNFFLAAFIVELFAGLIEVSTFTLEVNGFNAGSSVVIFLFAGIFLGMILKYNKKIKQLRI